MADGERRQVRRKTKPEDRPSGNGTKPARSGQDAMRAGYAKAEVKNQKVRESLEPLEAGERPTVVTVGAIFATVAAVLLWGSVIFALITGAKVNGESVNVTQWGMLAAIFSLMGWGMWGAKYWAVLGFQMLLVLLILACVLGLVVAETLLQMVSTLILSVGLCFLFYFMVKAMARIQMPDRPGDR